MAVAKLRPGDSRDKMVAKFEIEHEDVFHLKNLYKMIHEWLGEEGYKSADGDGDKCEFLYVDQTLSHGAKNHHVWWRTIRVPNDNTYYRYFMKVDFQTLNVSGMQIMHEGKKFKTNKGDVIIRVEAWLQLDYKNLFEDDKLMSRFNKWFQNRYHLKMVSKYKKVLYRSTYRLHSAIKQYLKLKAPTARNWGRAFHQPDKGI